MGNLAATQLVYSPKQCSCTHGTLCAEVSHKNKTPVVSQLPYSSDLSPADFFLFAKLKANLKGCRSGSVDKLKNTRTANADLFKAIYAMLGKTEPSELLYECRRRPF
jgi:hypothetical protein